MATIEYYPSDLVMFLMLVTQLLTQNTASPNMTSTTNIVSQNQLQLTHLNFVFVQAVNDTLPGTLLDPSSIIFDTSFKCESGTVNVDDKCVPCPPGTYFDEAEQSCTKCAIGFFNPDFAQRACTKCPKIGDLEGVTKSVGATKRLDCKQKCPAGHKYDEVESWCPPCEFGSYQPEEGKFR